MQCIYMVIIFKNFDYKTWFYNCIIQQLLLTDIKTKLFIIIIIIISIHTFLQRHCIVHLYIINEQYWKEKHIQSQPYTAK